MIGGGLGWRQKVIMADEVDRANDLAQTMVEMALKASPAPSLKKIGRCHNCEEPTSEAFCCPECRDDFEKRNKALRIAGRL